MRNSLAVRSLIPGLLFALLSLACGPPTLRPSATTDPTVACPGGTNEWSLEVLDQRANREGSEKLVALLRDSLKKSFPGCTWSAAGGANSLSLLIEVHRFSAPLEEGSWNGAAEWGVLVRNVSGGTLVDFEARAEVARPNYRGVDNEKAALQEVFNEALTKTLAVIKSVRSAG